MELFKNISLYTAVLLTGLSAGLFYAWQVSVIPGTKLISDKNYLDTMQSINRAIQNPAFALIFFGSFLLLLAATYTQYQEGSKSAFIIITAAMVCYLVGTIGITMLGNVPMNEALDKIDLNNMTQNALHQTRTTYEHKWNQLHLARTVFSVVAFALSLLTCFLNTNSN
ncbi:MAG: DUF1772 domain-containing protein [Flavipsychrobacter sp.]